MTKPICDRAEVALEYPDKLERSRIPPDLMRISIISLTLELSGPDEQRKSVRMRFH
jgi:hypothetical protein